MKDKLDWAMLFCAFISIFPMESALKHRALSIENLAQKQLGTKVQKGIFCSSFSSCDVPNK
jgi:hypothetical protein